MNKSQILEQFKNIRKYKKAGKPVPYKALVLLYALSEHVKGGVRLIPFADMETKLKRIAGRLNLGDKLKVEYPFWRLQNDGIWQVSTDHDVRPNSQGDVSRKQLVDANAKGGLKEEIIQLLQQDENFREQLIELCLNDVDLAIRSQLRGEFRL